MHPEVNPLRARRGPAATHLRCGGVWPRLALLAVASLTAAGCMRHEYIVSGTVPRTEGAYSTWQHNFLWGAVSATNPVDVRGVCPEGLSRIESEIAFEQALLHLVTAGLYAPTKMHVYCRRLPAAAGDLGGAAAPAP